MKTKQGSVHKLGVAIDYIENHIHEKLTLEQIATASDISKYHLHHMFKATTQQRLMDYVRNRKLSCSIQALLQTNLKLIDIAHEFGFAYEQSYIRSFQRFFHISPTRFRHLRPQVTVTDKLHLSCLEELANDSFMVSPEIVVKPGFWLVGTRDILRYDDEGFYHRVDQHGNIFFFQQRGKIAHAKASYMYIGVIRYLASRTNQREYITGLEVYKADDVPADMVSQFIPSQKYAVFNYVGLHHPQETTLAHILRMYEYIFEKWLPSSGYYFAQMYQMEYIDSRIARDDYCEINLYIPISENKQAAVSSEWLKIGRAATESAGIT